MTVRDKALLDSRLARLMRMIGLAMLATALASPPPIRTTGRDKGWLDAIEE